MRDADVRVRRDYVVQADKGSGNWYDFSIWGERDLALADKAEQVEHRKGDNYRLVERITIDITEIKQ